MSDEFLTFEKVSIAEARAAQHGPEVKAREAVNWTEKRNAALPSDLALLKETEVWLSALPDHVKPRHLASQFPRVTNKIFGAWRRPEICVKLFDELMTDSRGTRQGFPVTVAKDITNLRVYYTTEVFKMKQDTWILTA
ncbi:MAG: hypothetical protein C4516_00160 [Oxalobacter sp.]|nr:MAG: hypothetical protein C4516_00160 [Oxalobacter sp.]